MGTGELALIVIIVVLGVVLTILNKVIGIEKKLEKGEE